MKSSSKQAKGLKLVACVSILFLIWGFILPVVAQLPVVQQKRDKVDSLQIDPGALFYTDHPGYEKMIYKMEQRLANQTVQ